MNAGTVRCFVFTSSIAVYGAAQVPMVEGTVPRPIDPYGIAKYAVELDLEEARRTFGLDFVVFRPHNVYGEGQNIGDRYRNVIAIFMSQLLKGEPMTIFGDGEQTRAFTHVADVTPLIARSVERPAVWNQVFNVGADAPCTVNRLAAAVARARRSRCRHTSRLRNRWGRRSTARSCTVFTTGVRPNGGAMYWTCSTSTGSRASWSGRETGILTNGACGVSRTAVKFGGAASSAMRVEGRVK